MPDVGRLIIAAVLGAAIALFARHILSGDDPQDAQANSNAGAIEGDADGYGAAAELEVRLANLELGQRRLVDELAAIRTQAQSGVAGESSASADSTAGVDQPVPQVNPATAGVASVQSLTAAGIDPVNAQAMIERLDELALARLQADYQVRRENGNGEAARQARLDRRAIPRDSETIRAEFGDEAYDQYLYSLNQPNRVQVASVLGDSSAQIAGVQDGDFLRSLDGEPLFNVRDLTRRISEGDTERTYSLLVERDGEVIETWVPGGPLGVRVSGSVAEPDG